MNLSIKRTFKPKDGLLRIIGIPLTTVLATFVLSGFFKGAGQLPLSKVLLCNLILTWAGWELSLLILLWARKKYPGIDQIRKRLGVSLIIYLISVILIDSFFVLISDRVSYLAHYTWTPATFGLLVLLGTTIAMIICCLYEAVYFFSLWKKTAQEKEQLRQENLNSQFQSLKNQVNPHFLFNSLNSLSSLIECDKKRAVEFIHGMSKVYRYILESNQHDLTTLGNELEFIRSYFYLLNTRFGENLKEEIMIPEKCLQKRIPPLTLQILVENAVKHNIVSANKPLYLKIFSESGNEITVRNNLQKKVSMLSSSHFGLRNINNRYELLNQPGIRIDESELSYSVSVPLIS